MLSEDLHEYIELMLSEELHEYIELMLSEELHEYTEVMSTFNNCLNAEPDCWQTDLYEQ